MELLDDWGGVVNSGPVKRGPIRLADLYKIASRYATKPIKVSVGAGPVNLAWHVYFQHYKDARELSFALAPIFNAEMKDLVAAGAKYLADRGSRRVASAVHRRQRRLQVDRRRDRAVHRRRRRENRMALLLRQRLGECADLAHPGGLRNGASALLPTCPSISSCWTSPTGKWPISSA